MVRPTLQVVPAEVDPALRMAAQAQHDPAAQHDVAQPLALLFGGSEWTVRAVCVGVDPDALFVTGAAQREAAKICQACPVRLECLADALDHQIEYGVWGGMTERQRRAVLKKSPDVSSWRALLEEARGTTVHEAAS